jgi:hypothetical protein
VDPIDAAIAVVADLTLPVFGALLAYVYWCYLVPQLRARRARPAALVISGGLMAAAVLLLGLAAVEPAGALHLIVAGNLLVLVTFAAIPLLVRTTGGAGGPSDGRYAVSRILSDAFEAVERKDADRWEGAVRRMGSVYDPAAIGVRQAFRDYVRESAGELPPRDSTRGRLEAEVQRYVSGETMVQRRWVAGSVLIAFAVGVTPAIAAGEFGRTVCGDALTMATGTTGLPASPDTHARALLLNDAGPAFTLIRDAPMSLQQSAASRVDPATLDALREHGFVEAHNREWLRDDGTGLSNDAFAFSEPAGAAGYHRDVTRYACIYSEEAFVVPGGGVGLRIRYGSGDPIRDQVAWVDGNHRVVVAIGYREPPAGHEEIVALVDALR